MESRVSGDNETSKALKAALGKASHPVYAVLDGAKFDNLPDLLFDHDFSHKPLYQDMGSEIREIAQTTPQFIRFDKWAYWENDLTPAQRLDALLELLDDTSAAVFWEYKGEPKRLFRHLRTINNVMIPRDADTPPLPDPLDPDGETYGNTATHQQVLFRHADANVMAQVLPCLSDPQITRVMGPASGLIFAPDPEWAAGEDIMTVTNPKDTYNARHPLKLNNPDMDRIENRRLNGIRRQIALYLRKYAPNETKLLGNDALMDQVIYAENVGNKIGFKDHSSFELFTLLGVLTKGEIFKNKQVLRDLEDRYLPDKKIESVFENHASIPVPKQETP